MAGPAVASERRAAYDHTVNDDELRRLVKNAGMEIFAGYYNLFTDPSLTAQDIHRRLVADHPHHCPDALYTRIYAGRKLVTHGLAHPALRIIANSPRVRDDLRRQALELFQAGDGAGITAGSFTVDVTLPGQENAHTSGQRRPRGLLWYRAGDGLLCADVHGKIAGALTLEVEPCGRSFTARARGFLATVIHEIAGHASEDAALDAIAHWWAQVEA